MFTPEFSNQFKRSYKRMMRRNANPELMEHVISLICKGEPLPASFKEHNLSGKYSKYKECHILPDWLLIYKKIQKSKSLILPIPELILTCSNKIN